MKVPASLKDAYESNRWGFVLRIFLSACGIVALVSAEWVSAVTMFSVVALFSAVDFQGTRGSRAEEPPMWTKGAILAGGIGFLGVAVADALSGNVVGVVLSGLAAATALVGSAIDWRRSVARRLLRASQ